MVDIIDVVGHSVIITIFVFFMMLITDYVNVLSKGKMSSIIRGGIWRQYTVSSFLGVTPGCLGAFMNVSFYARGLLSFGAIVGGMIATSGDEAFVMLALFPKIALLLFGLLFVFGIVFGFVSDRVAKAFKIQTCQQCKLATLHLDDSECKVFDTTVWRSFPRIMYARVILMVIVSITFIALVTGFIGSGGPDWEKVVLVTMLAIMLFVISTVSNHYLKEHIWNHLVREHIWRIFLWTFFALLVVSIGMKYWNLESFVRSHIGWVLIVSAVIGIIPESGPHLIFVAMFSQGIIPFSVLLTSSFVQDGHGMLPLLSYSVKDAALIKSFNLVFGIIVGLILYSIGL